MKRWRQRASTGNFQGIVKKCHAVSIDEERRNICVTGE